LLLKVKEWVWKDNESSKSTCERLCSSQSFLFLGKIILVSGIIISSFIEDGTLIQPTITSVTFQDIISQIALYLLLNSGADVLVNKAFNCFLISFSFSINFLYLMGFKLIGIFTLTSLIYLSFLLDFFTQIMFQISSYATSNQLGRVISIPAFKISIILLIDKTVFSLGKNKVFHFIVNELNNLPTERILSFLSTSSQKLHFENI
jgi:hypothetical protein